MYNYHDISIHLFYLFEIINYKIMISFSFAEKMKNHSYKIFFINIVGIGEKVLI